MVTRTGSPFTPDQARAANAARTRHAFACAVCGIEAVSQNTRSRFCSNRCKQADKYARREGK